MQLPAVLKDQEADAELSILDIVVHSCRTVIHSLSAEDKGQTCSSNKGRTSLTEDVKKMWLVAGKMFLVEPNWDCDLHLIIIELGQTTLCRTHSYDGLAFFGKHPFQTWVSTWVSTSCFRIL